MNEADIRDVGSVGDVGDVRDVSSFTFIVGAAALIWNTHECRDEEQK